MHPSQRQAREQALQEYHRRRRTGGSVRQDVEPLGTEVRRQDPTTIKKQQSPRNADPRQPSSPRSEQGGSSPRVNATHKSNVTKESEYKVLLVYSWEQHQRLPLADKLEQKREESGAEYDVWQSRLMITDKDGSIVTEHIDTLVKRQFPVNVQLSRGLKASQGGSQRPQGVFIEPQEQEGVKAPAASNMLFVCGGCGTSGPLNSVEVYDPNTGHWQPVPSMSEHRAWAAVALLGRMIYVCGGRHGDVPYSSVERYDIDRKRWEAAPPMLEKRALCAAVSVDDSIYIFGGRHDSGYIITAECFDSKASCWQALPQMIRERSGAAVAAIGRKVYVCGGQNASGFLNAVEYLDVESYQWHRQPNMMEPRTLAAAVAREDLLYVCGGKYGKIVFCSVERFNPKTRQWDFLPPMSSRRAEVAAARMGDNIYVCGGWDGFTCVNTAEYFNPKYFNPETSRWKSLPPMQEIRFAASAVALTPFEDPKKNTKKRDEEVQKAPEDLQSKFKASMLVKLHFDATETALGIIFEDIHERFVGAGWNIKVVKDGTLASFYQLQPGDELVRANGERLVDMSESRVKEILKVRPVVLEFLRLVQPSQQITVTFAEDEEGPLGLVFGSYSAARESGKGWKIVRVKDAEGMLAQNHDIRPDDEIVRINGQKMIDMEEDVAIRQMKRRPLALDIFRSLQEVAGESLTGFSLQKIGKCVSLSKDRLTASYVGSGSELLGGVLGDGPIRYFVQGAYFEVRIAEVLSGNSDGLAIGVTRTSPADPKQIPLTLDSLDHSWLMGFDGRMWDSNLDDFTDVNWYPSGLSVGDRVGVLITRSGKMIVFVNDDLAAEGPENIPYREPLYPAVDLLGNTRAVILLLGADPSALRLGDTEN